METWRTLVQDDPVSWLLDPSDPAVRHLALRWINDLPPDSPDVLEAQAQAMQSPPINTILDLQRPDGSWQEVEHTFSPMYRSTIWQIIFLAGLGADGADERVRKGVEHILTADQDEDGTFPVEGSVYHGQLLCVTSMTLEALLALGYAADSRVQEAMAAVCNLVKDEDTACKYNADLPCAWGAVKALRALAIAPAEGEGTAVCEAKDLAAALILTRDPAVGDYPTKSKPSSHWRRLAVPRGFQSDALEALEALALAGQGHNPSLVPTIQFILQRQNAQGRWHSSHYLNGRMLADWEPRGRESKWVTLHAIRTLRMIVG
jgi:hypothetical protein